jgi:hypothetical protein
MTPGQVQLKPTPTWRHFLFILNVTSKDQSDFNIWWMEVIQFWFQSEGVQTVFKPHEADYGFAKDGHNIQQNIIHI